MPKPVPPPPTNKRMIAVHALGHPNSPAPRTRWMQPAHGRAGEPAALAPVTPPPAPTAPNAPNAASLAQSTGSDLTVTWAAPAVDSSYNQATGYALRWSPAAAGTWTIVGGVTSPYHLSALPSGATRSTSSFKARTPPVRAPGPPRARSPRPSRVPTLRMLRRSPGSCRRRMARTQS